MELSAISMKKWFGLFIHFLLVCGLLLTAVPLWAQTPPTAVITGEQVTEGEDGVQMDLHFLLLDENGQPRPNATVTNASVLLTDGSQTPAQISKPPFYMALVIDASGSMEGSLDKVRSSAIDLVNNAPPELQFAVIRFDDNIELVQPFTADHNQIIAAINQIQIEDDGTCFYDVAFTALQTLEQQLTPENPRRAMVVFTDGRDETQRGSGEACSQYTYDQVLASAANLQLPIHTIGIADSKEEINSAALSKLSEVTGGLSTSDNEDQSRSQLIQQLLDSVNSQWLATTNLFPDSGVQRGSLLLTLDNGELPAPIPLAFITQRSYTTAPLPPAMDIANFRYDAATDTFTFDVLLTNMDNADILQVETVDPENNLQVDLLNFTNSGGVSYRVLLPATSLTPQRWYTTQVAARTGDGRFVRDAAGNIVSASYEFRYDPVQPLVMEIESVVIEDEAAQPNWRTWRMDDTPPEMIVTLLLANDAVVAGYTGNLVDLTTNQYSDAFVIEPTRTADTAVAQIPVDIAEGTYTLVVQAQAADGSRLATDNTQFTYIAPEGELGRAGLAVQSNPILLLIFALTVFLITFLGWRVGHTMGKRRGTPGANKGLNLAALPNEPAPVVPTIQVLLVLQTSSDPALTAVGRWPVTHFPFTIGREGCDLIIANDQHVSRRHARITFKDGDYFIEDLGSSNGTHINATQIAAHEPFSISAERGERIRIGKTTTFLFQEETLTSADASTNNQQPTTNNQQLTTNNQQLTTNN
jgi:VWFA-related protein